jgi:hypothetical protein
MSQENYNESFMNTVFKVLVDDTRSYDIRVGSESVLEDLNMPDLESWAYITAWNPLPIIYRLDENRMRNQSLKNDLDAMNFECIDGIGMAIDGSWQEESVFIKNISKEQAESLAQKYKQVAYLFAHRNEKAQLIYTVLEKK